MKYRYKTNLYATLFIINILFIIFYPKSLNFNFNNVIADSESFNLKDGFETFIENKIYSEEENLTIPEYFKDVYMDACDFTEDTEGFEYHSHGIGLLYYDIDYSDGKLTLDIKTSYGFNSYWVKYNLDDIGLSLIHYDYLEVRAKCNPISYNPSIYFENQEGEKIVSVEDRFMLTDEFQNFYHKIDINENFYENTTTLSIVVYDHNCIDLEYNYYEIDYIKFWRNNITDYATQELSDSWDWSENDLDTHILSVYKPETVEYSDGFLRWVKATDTAIDYTYAYISQDIDYINYNFFQTNIWCNSSDYDILGLYFVSDDTTVHFELGSTIANTWVSFEYDLSLSPKWDGDIHYRHPNGRFQVRFSHKEDLVLSDEFKMDYVLINHNNFEDKVFYQSQNTSFYRASSGLYSYHHNFDRNIINPYGDFSFITNSCVIIDIPTLSMFPQKIEFDIYSNSYFNVSFFVAGEEFVLYEKTVVNEWVSIGKVLNREDYILEDLEADIYFKIYSENQFIENYLEYYIDELEIRYTENREIYKYNAESYNPEYNDYWSFNVTNNNLFAEPSGIGEYAMGEETFGCKYNVSSNTLFSRRAYHSFRIEVSSMETNVRIHHYSTFIIDKEYYIITIIIVNHLLTPEGSYINTHIKIYNALSIDGEEYTMFNERTLTDYFFPNMFYFEFNTEIVQEDYNTVRVSSNYISTTTGNSTVAQPFSFEINTENIEHALNLYSFETFMEFTPSYKGGGICLSNPIIIVAIERDITHSDLVESGMIADMPKVPIWDDDLGFWKNVWNILKYIVIAFWYGLVNVATIGTNFKEFFMKIKLFFMNMGNFISSMATNFKDIFTKFGLIITSLFSTEGILGNLWNTIIDIFGSIGDMWGFLQDFFSNFGDFWSEMWGGLMDFFSGDWVDFLISFVTADWDGVRTSWGLMMQPIFDFDITAYWSSIFGGFFSDFFGLDFFSLFGVAKEFFQIFALVSTILIVIYLIHLFKLVGNRDWYKFKEEISGIVKIVSWVIEKSIMIIKWIIDMIISLINAIPFI